MVEDIEKELKEKLKNWARKYGLRSTAKKTGMSLHYVRVAILDPKRYLDEAEKLTSYFKELDLKQEKRLAELINN